MFVLLQVLILGFRNLDETSGCQFLDVLAKWPELLQVLTAAALNIFSCVEKKDAQQGGALNIRTG